MPMPRGGLVLNTQEDRDVARAHVRVTESGGVIAGGEDGCELGGKITSTSTAAVWEVSRQNLVT